MVGQIVHAPTQASPFRDAFTRIREELQVPAAFPADALEEADAIARAGPRTEAGDRRDARDIPFVTIDPAGSRDLDQAFHAERRPGGGFRVHYAIADVAAFVAPGGALDRESFLRGVTLYLPDGRAPMLPEVLCEGAASLLAGDDRPAVVWTVDLDGDGAATSTRVERATIRNRVALSFDEVQQRIDAGTAEEPLALLREIGTRRRDLETARGGISLDLPAQEVEPAAAGGYTLVYRAPLPVETWNAQISLLTGIEAAKLMIGAHVGILRTLPPPQSSQITRLRRSAGALHIGWPKGMSWGALANRLDRSRPPDAAFLIQAAHVLRGAGYAVLDASNTREPSATPHHAGVAAPYAHVTAPLRRLGDRYANEIVLAASAGTTPPDWATANLEAVATAMQSANHHSAQIERAVIDAVECVLLLPRVGATFEAVVIDRNEHGAIVQLTQPAVVASMASDAALGARLTVRLESVDPVARRLLFQTA